MECPLPSPIGLQPHAIIRTWVGSVGGVAPATLVHEEPKIVLLAVTGSEGKNAGGDHLERSERRRVGG